MADRKKVDPVGERYFAPLGRAEVLVDVLFYVSAAFSFLALFVGQSAHPGGYSAVQIGFVLSVVAFFAGNLVVRLYFSPRAQERRLEDFLAHAYKTPLSHEQTKYYYINSATTVPARIAAQVLEKSFYSKSTASSMLPLEGLKVGAYLVIWLIAILNRSTDLTLLGVAAQILFSEQMISRWLRLEWLRFKCEGIFNELFECIQRGASLNIPAVRLLGKYEIAKAAAGIMLSTRVFEKHQERTNREWEQIRITLEI
jgi:hypothetical protein